MLKSAAFLDRDGVINKDNGYVYKVSDFEWIDESRQAIKYLNDNNYYVFVITNQSGISRKLYSLEDVKNLHKHINNELSKMHAHVDEFFISPYHPDNPLDYSDLSHLRKPDVGMLKLAETKWTIKKEKSFLIGDKQTDIECAEKFGIKGHLFKGGSLFDFIKISID